MEQQLETCTREPGEGETCPHNLEAVPPPPILIVNVVHFHLVLFLHVNLGLSQKIVGQIRDFFLVLGRDYLGPRETFAPPPPQLQSSSRAPGQRDGFTILEDCHQYLLHQPEGVHSLSRAQKGACKSQRCAYNSQIFTWATSGG